MVFIISDLSVTGLVLLFIEGSSRYVLMVGGFSLCQGAVPVICNPSVIAVEVFELGSKMLEWAKHSPWLISQTPGTAALK